VTILRQTFATSNDLGPFWAWASQGLSESIRKTMDTDTKARLLYASAYWDVSNDEYHWLVSVDHDQDLREMELEDLQELLETR